MPASLVHPTRAEGNAERKGWPAAEGTTTVSACPYACDGTPMTVRGGGIPRRPLALTPNGRMGPPLRSFAADAHDCIMVRVLGPTGYKVVARLNRVPKAGSPLIVIATALSVPSCSKPSRYGLARAKHAARLVRRPILTASARIDQRCAGRDEETDFEIKSRNRRRKKMRGPGKFLDKESAIQGPLVPIPKRSTSP